MVSLDTFRVGAVEQWRRRADLSGSTSDVATNPETTQRAVSSYAASEMTGVVLIKLDETDRVGGVHDAAIDRSLDAIFPEQA